MESSTENDYESKQLCYCCFCVTSNGDRKLTMAGRNDLSKCIKVQKSTMFFLQAFVVWTVLCLPGNIVTLILYQQANTFKHQVSSP